MRALKTVPRATDRGHVFKKSRPAKNAVVGLELDSGHIAAAEVAVDGSVVVRRGAVAALRPNVLRDGEVTDPAALTEALAELFAEHELPRRVRIGIANQRIVVRTLDLPPVSDPNALAAAVDLEAPDHIPMPIEEAVLDFQPIGDVDTLAGRRTRVVVVAVRRDSVERLAQAAAAAGLTVEGIDLSAFAMVRALADGGDRAVLYISVAGLVNVAVANASGCLFTRAAAGGLDAMVATLAERRGLTSEHARQWMRHVGVTADLEGIEGDADLVAATRGVLEEGVHHLADTIRNSLNFYRMQSSAEAVEQALVTGPAIEVPGFVERLAALLDMPVEAATVGSDDSALDAGRLTIAAGLAVEARP